MASAPATAALPISSHAIFSPGRVKQKLEICAATGTLPRRSLQRQDLESRSRLPCVRPQQVSGSAFLCPNLVGISRVRKGDLSFNTDTAQVKSKRSKCASKRKMSARASAKSTKDGETGRDSIRSQSSVIVDAGIKAGSALFGKGLPPGLLIQTAEAAWRGTWKIMMSQVGKFCR
jgi:hypothetical protein